MRWMVIYEYEVPGGALNLSSTKTSRPWSPWESSLSRKNPHGRTGKQTRDLMFSSQKLWPLDHKVGLVYEFFNFCQSAARYLSSFQFLPASLISDLLQLFFGLPLFLLPWGFHIIADFDISQCSLFSVWPIHPYYLFLISKVTSSWPVAFQKSISEIFLGHHVLKIYVRYQLTKVCILRRISLVTNHVPHPYKNRDFM
jgi:hypothetical protein